MEQQKVALITGASKGIGAAIVKKMASLNYHIVLNYFTSDTDALALKKTVEKLFPVQVLLVKADIRNEEEVIHMLQVTIDTFHRIDVLVNNAALCKDNYFDEKSSSEFLEVLNTNLVGVFLTCKYFGKYMFEQKKGEIVNLSSTNGIDTNEIYSMDYDASKAGVISLTHNFSKALAPYVRVNAIAPGWTKTESVMEMNPNYLKEEEQKILLERFAEPSEIASVVAFLVSEEASYVNDSVIRVDGGLK